MSSADETAGAAAEVEKKSDNIENKTGEEKKEDKPATERCATRNCPNLAKQMCPKCIQMRLHNTFFCSQECFKKGWPEHNLIHKQKVVETTYPFAGKLRPGYVSPMRIVPSHIPRPDYADHPDGTPKEEATHKMRDVIPIYTKDEIQGIREACRIGREVLDIAARYAKPGVTCEEIDRVVHEATIAKGAYPSPLNYRGFPKSCCTSVNEIICHGIPDDRKLVDGDIINIDITCYYKGFHGDLNETYTVGNVKDDSKKLIQVTHDSLMESLNAIKPGMMCRDFGSIISKIVSKENFSVVRSYCGHGIGRLFHCNPNIPHYARNKAVGVLKPGMIFTVEPMINMGGWEDITWPDDWTSSTADGMRSAQFEHTVLVTEDGYEILTARTEKSRPLWWEEKEGDTWMNDVVVESANKKKKKNKKKNKNAVENAGESTEKDDAKGGDDEDGEEEK